MAPIVYQDAISPPNQSVALVLRKTGLDSVVEIRNMSLQAGDHLKPDFVKKFPLHTVPAMEDGDLYLTESHAIIPYLINAYAKEDSLYPKDAKKRAKVDQWLHFSNCILYNRLRDMSEPLWLKQRKDVPEERKKRAFDALKTLENALGTSPFLCGDILTLADIACVCEYYGIAAVVDVSELKGVTAWAKRCQDALPGFKEIVLVNHEKYKAVLKFMMS